MVKSLSRRFSRKSSKSSFRKKSRRNTQRNSRKLRKRNSRKVSRKKKRNMRKTIKGGMFAKLKLQYHQYQLKHLLERLPEKIQQEFLNTEPNELIDLIFGMGLNEKFIVFNKIIRKPDDYSLYLKRLKAINTWIKIPITETDNNFTTIFGNVWETTYPFKNMIKPAVHTLHGRLAEVFPN